MFAVTDPYYYEQSKKNKPRDQIYEELRQIYDKDRERGGKRLF